MCTSGNIHNRGAVVVIGAGNATGGAIARRFAKEGYTACVSRRNILLPVHSFCTIVPRLFSVCHINIHILQL